MERKSRKSKTPNLKGKELNFEKEFKWKGTFEEFKNLYLNGLNK